MKENTVQTKSFQFSIDIIRIYKYLILKKEFVLSKQLLRSGTSIGANIYEAQGGFSRKEFIVKIQIAYKEVLETLYWLRLLNESEYLDKEKFEFLHSKCDELRKIIASIQKTSKGE